MNDRRAQNILGHLCSASAIVPSPLSNQAKESIAKERQNPSFPVEELSHYLFGGKQKFALFQQAGAQLERDHIFREDYHDLPPKQHREVVYARVKRMLEYKLTDSEDLWKARRQVVSNFDPSLDIRIGIHAVLFREAIAQNGTEEQLKRWLPDVDAYKLPGCFAMTELGHGSYVQGCETTATFDPEFDEFVIHTPTDTATKWWIGGAAHSALACACYARLIINGKDYGVYNFFVPLRRRHDFSLLPGVNIGDCGAKMGRLGIDNGWIQFTHVRIPRDYMLMRWAKVERDGKFHQSPSIQLSYGALVEGRVGMATNAAEYAKKAVTIALRYGVCRRQFPSVDKEEKAQKKEQAILDYATHMHKLLPILAEAYALHFAAAALVHFNERVQEELKSSKIENLNDLHATSAGMKAFSTWFTIGALETCRQTLGGHGFSSYNGIVSLARDYGVNVSWEGENTVMALQTARLLTKSFAAASKGQKLTGDSAYLARFKTILSSKFPESATLKDFRVVENQIQIFEYIATKQVHDASNAINAAVKAGSSAEDAWNQTSVQLSAAAKAHYYLFVVRSFANRLEQLGTSSALYAPLKLLFDLFTLFRIQSELAVLLEEGFLNARHSQVVTQSVLVVCRELRPHAIPLTDAFGFSDFLLQSPLARYDGDIYTAYFNRVKSAPESQGRPYYYDSLVSKVMQKHHLPSGVFD